MKNLDNIMKQAGIIVPTGVSDTCHMKYSTLEKFAELIVRECAYVANEHVEDCEGVTFGVGRILRNHFGVE
jgi:hypothetical protein